MIAQLHIQVAAREGRSYLEQTYFTPPFKVANITEDKQSPWLHLMIMNSSPGVLDGDAYTTKIEIKENASLHLHTQSYQRLFNMKEGARQFQEVHLSHNTRFVYLPHPAVPHENAVFITSNKIYLKKESQLIWGEILTCGRKLNGEVFRFSKFHSVTEIFVEDQLTIKENLLVQPAEVDPARLGQLEGYTHQASLIFFNNGKLSQSCQDEIHEYLAMQPDILYGISTTACNGMIVRILGYAGEQLHQYLQSIATLLQQKEKQHVKSVHAN